MSKHHPGQHGQLLNHISYLTIPYRSDNVQASAWNRPVCDSYVRPETLVRICDECNFGTYGGRCIICGSPGISDAYYCAECTRLEKDRDGCPKIVNLGASRTDLFYERRRLGSFLHLGGIHSSQLNGTGFKKS
ncbi:PHF5-like protein-domain-containing protein [Boletus reticuloceps]|uniref:PHF5-like protein-domain-containing protein n=1 Tax=Boletus reticuloceps TaxID=495285 RepID=A0A8I3AGG5_9AGAM|nr:PHF5-like protein-domain-containing protein [Boletus reticuloceps]